MNVCSVCNSRVAPGATECPNCHSKMLTNLGVQYKKKDQKDVSQQPAIQDMYVSAQNLSLPPAMDDPMMPGLEDSMSVAPEMPPTDEDKKNRKRIEKKKEKERVHRSEEIKMMSDPNENSDSNIEEVQQSMDDLAFDS